MIFDMRGADTNGGVEQATIIVNARLHELLRSGIEGSNAKIISFDSFTDERACSASKIKEFLEKRESICPQLELIDLSRACSPDADLESEEAKRFSRFVKALKENTDIEIVATPELEKLFPILLQENKEDDELSEAYVIPLQEEKYSALRAVTKLQLAQAEKQLSPELCHEILEHSNNNVVAQRVISAIDAELNEGNGELAQYVPTLLGCIAGRYITSDNFDAIVGIAEKYITQDSITTEDINFCFELQKESSQSEESYQRINNLIKELIPHLPEDVRQDLDEKAALKEKKQQEYLQKRQNLQAKVNEYGDFLLLSDAIYKDVSSEHIRKVGNTIYENAGQYESLYVRVLSKIYDEHDEYKIKAASHWIEPVIFSIDTHGLTGSNKRLANCLTLIVTQNQDVRHEYGHIFCEQLKKSNDSKYWIFTVRSILNKNKDDHILLMNTYEDMEQAYKLRPELIPDSLALFKETLKYPDIEKGFNDHLHTLASIVGDTAHDHPEFTDTAIEILSDLTDIEKNLYDSPSKSYFRSKIDEAFDKIEQNDITPDLKRDLVIIHEKDPKIFANAVKELMNNPQTDQQHIENAIKMRLNSRLDVLVDDYDSAECLKWNLAVLQSEALQNKGPEDMSACAEQIFRNGVLDQLENNPNYDPSEAMQAIYDAAPFCLNKMREKISNDDDLLILQAFDRIPKKVQQLYIGEYYGKIDNLIKTGTFEDFPELAVQKLKYEVCDYLSDITSEERFDKKRSISGMEKAAAVLKEINGYSSPEVCVAALYDAMRIRAFVSLPSKYTSCEHACEHFYCTDEDIKPFVKISTDIIDIVFEQIRQQKDHTALTDALKNATFYDMRGKMSLKDLMGEEAANAFLSGDENYKKLWDKKMASEQINAYLMFEKPGEILQDTPFDERRSVLSQIASNTYLAHGYYGDKWNWKDFPELLYSLELESYVDHSPDKAAEDVVKAVKTFCKAQLDDTRTAYNANLLAPLMVVYDVEAKKDIEDKELFSILYKARFSKNNKSAQDTMERIYYNYGLTSPKLKSLCETSYLINRWKLKNSTNEK